MWAGHQTHHSSEVYNLSTALRQSAVHRYIGWVKNKQASKQTKTQICSCCVLYSHIVCFRATYRS